MKFLDLFAGIGGFRLGLESAGHECVGFCETFEYGEDDITDKLSHIVDLIDIDDDKVEIYLENYTIPLYK